MQTEQQTSLLDLSTVMRTRRTVTDFLPQPIPNGLVEELLETAVYAPNHRLTEPWSFIYLTGEGVRGYAAIRKEMALRAVNTDDPLILEKVGESAYRKFADLPGILIVSMKLDSDPEIQEEDYAACAALTQNFLLLAWARGLGTAWKTFKESPQLRNYLGLAALERVVSVIHVGYPARASSGQRRPAKATLRYLR